MARQNHASGIDLLEIAPPATPATGQVRLYAKSDGLLYSKDDAGVETVVTGGGGGSSAQAWEGQLHVAWGNGEPDMREILWSFSNSAVSVAGPTPTGVGTGVGRLVRFRFKTALTVNRVRVWGIAAVSNLYTLAIYQGTTRVFMQDPLNTTANAWTSLAASFTVPADTVMWLGLGAKAVGTTSGIRSTAAPISGVLNGNVALPGNIDNHVHAKFAQVALTLGAWPTTLPALAAPGFVGGSTGTLPIVFLDNNGVA